MNKLWVFFTLVIVSTKTFGCICWFSTDKKSIKERIKRADMIVYATAVSDTSAEETTDSISYITDLVFKVDKVWKGKKVGMLKLAPKERPCEEASYKIGERYIIFGYINRETGKLEANTCSSLSEETRPDPIDERKITSDFDIAKYQKAMADMRDEFESVKRLIVKRTKRY